MPHTHVVYYPPFDVIDAAEKFVGIGLPRTSISRDFKSARDSRPILDVKKLRRNEELRLDPIILDYNQTGRKGATRCMYIQRGKNHACNLFKTLADVTYSNIRVIARTNQTSKIKYFCDRSQHFPDKQFVTLTGSEPFAFERAIPQSSNETCPS